MSRDTGATVRDAVFEVMRRTGMTTIFANPGSTEIEFLTGLSADLTFRLALHEGSVVGMATGWALAQGRPAFVNLHTTAGLANAAGALATARTNRAPLVVVVGQQDRRHLAHEPFLAGRLDGLLGEYPVWTNQPAHAQDVPGAIARAYHEAVTAAGPAVVVVPMDDWLQPARTERPAAPSQVRRADAMSVELDDLVSILDGATDPAIVVGAGNDSKRAWESTVALAERLGAPVWQEPFGARAGFPQTHPAFAGHLPSGRGGVRKALDGHDAVLVLGAPVLRQYPWEPGDLVTPETAVVQITQYADEAHNSVADISIIGDPGYLTAVLARRVRRRAAKPTPRSLDALALPADGAPMRPGHVFDVLRRSLPANTIVVEETPSSRPELHRRLPASEPLGFVSAAAGGLGFGLPAAIGLKMAAPSRPVLAVLGDGSSLYGIQGLWSAAHYGVGVVFLIMANGGYAIMDRLAEQSGLGDQPWPSFTEVDLCDVARGLGCPAMHVTTYSQLVEVLADILPTLADRTEPMLLNVTVAPDPSYG